MMESALLGEVNSIFDSCSDGSNREVKLEVLFNKISEVYGNVSSQAFVETLIPTLGSSPLEKFVTKEEFFNIIKKEFDTHSQAINQHSLASDDIIITPVSRPRYGKCSTPSMRGRISNLAHQLSEPLEFSNDSIEINHISPISIKQNTFSHYGTETLACINESLEKKLSIAETSINLLEKKLEREMNLKLKLMKENLSLREENKRLWPYEEQLTENNEKLNALENKYSFVTNECMKFKDIIETLEVQNSHLQQENTHLIEELKTKSNKVTEFEGTNNILTNEISTLKETMVRIVNERLQLMSREKTLLETIEQLRNEKLELRLQLEDMDNKGLNNMVWANLSENMIVHQLPGSGDYLASPGNVYDEMKELQQTEGMQHSFGDDDGCTIAVIEKNQTDNSTQTVLFKRDVGVYVVLPSPSEQLTSTRATQTLILDKYDVNGRLITDELGGSETVDLNRQIGESDEQLANNNNNNWGNQRGDLTADRGLIEMDEETSQPDHFLNELRKLEAATATAMKTILRSEVLNENLMQVTYRTMTVEVSKIQKGEGPEENRYFSEDSWSSSNSSSDSSKMAGRSSSVCRFHGCFLFWCIIACAIIFLISTSSTFDSLCCVFTRKHDEQPKYWFVWHKFRSFFKLAHHKGPPPV